MNYLSLLKHFKHKQVRDLVWLLLSPNILADNSGLPVLSQAWGEQQYYSHENWFQQLDTQPQALLTFLQDRNNQRLGLYFEDLFHFFTLHAENINLITHHWQCQQDKRTLGEIDFIIECEGQLYHIETAVKFYLSVDSQGKLDQYIGPAKKDNLSKKLNHMLTHQLPLVSHYPAVKVDKSLILMKGMLFYPAQHTSHVNPALNPKHACGHWHRYTKDPMPWEGNNTKWLILPRLMWLTPQTQSSNLITYHQQDIAQGVADYFEKYQQPVLIEGLVDGDKTQRHFILPADW